MQILSVHLKNIKSHRDSELFFSPGINVLSGINGAGKSTIFEAIGYALFGVDARDFVSNIDRFLTIGSKKGEVSVVFRTNDGETWRVSRTVGAGARWLLAREAGGLFEVEDHAGIEETAGRIAGLIGLDNGRSLSEQFKLVIGPFQNDFLGPFVIRQPTRRQEAFDEILGIDAWRKTYKGTSSLLSALQERIRILTAEVTLKQEQLEILPARETELAALRSDQIAREAGLKEKSAALLDAEQRLAGLDNSEKGIAALKTEIQVLEGRIREGEEKTITQRLRVDEAEKAASLVESARAGNAAHARAEAHLTELRQRELLRRQLDQEINTLEKEVLSLTQRVVHEREEIEKQALELAAETDRLVQARQGMQPDLQTLAVAAGLAEVRQQADLLKAERSLLEGRRLALLEGRDKLGTGVCPYFQDACRNLDGAEAQDMFTGLAAESDRLTGELNGRIEEMMLLVQGGEQAERELNTVQVRLQELDKQVVTLEQRRTGNVERAESLARLVVRQAAAELRFRTRKADLQLFAALDSEIASAEQARASFQDSRDLFLAHRKDALDLANRRGILEKMVKLLEELKHARAVRQGELTLLEESYQPEQHLEARREKDGLLTETATLRQQLAELGRTGQRLAVEIGRLLQLKGDVEGKQIEIRGLADKEKLVKFLRNQVFKQVSGQLSERFREEISLRADRIYRTIAESDEELHWGENYQIVLRDLEQGDVRERSDDQLSGGQMMSAVVALRLALLQTLGARVAFFDEPTSNLDAARRENLAHAFRAIEVGREEVTEHWYDQLFLVSHDVSFTEITDQVIEIGVR